MSYQFTFVVEHMANHKNPKYYSNMLKHTNKPRTMENKKKLKIVKLTKF